MVKRSGKRRTLPKVTVDSAIGPDADLATEIVRDAKGRRVDDAYVERVVKAAARLRGRPSLDVGRSPQVAFRLPPAMREQAARVAAAEGKSVSQLAREALEQRLNRSA